MKTVCAPPPPPPPPKRNRPLRVPTPPCPQHAAVPFLCDARLPVQETGDVSNESHDLQVSSHSSFWNYNDQRRLEDVTIKSPRIQDITTPLQTEDHNTAPSPPLHGQEDPESDDGEKQHPVQETDPAPQVFENPQLSETTEHDGAIGTDEDDDIQLPRSA